MRNLEELYRVALSGANFRIVQIPHPSLRAYAQNIDGHSALLVAGKLSEGRQIKDARGFTVKIDRESNNPTITIVSDKPGSSSLFLAFVDFILEHVAPIPAGPGALDEFARAVQEFHNFTARRAGRLSLDEVRGLVAELWLLRHLCKSGVPSPTAVASWRGPYATRGIGTLDFVFSNGICVEVKSARQPAISIYVSSPEQLVSRDTPVYLSVLPIEEVPIASPQGITLRELVRELEQIFALESPGDIDVFRRGLAMLSLDLEDDYYEQWKFQPGTFQCFEVRTNFPGIKLEAIDPGVVKINYSLLLSALAEFEVELDSVVSEIVVGNV